MKFRNIVVAAAMLLSFGLATSKAYAAEDATPVITLGNSLSEGQKKGTLEILKGALSDSSSYNTLTVTGDDLVTYLNPAVNNFTSSSGVWSSAAIEKTSSGSGINVRILSYNGENNITSIVLLQHGLCLQIYTLRLL